MTTRSLALVGGALALCSAPARAATDPFAPYIDHVPPLLKTISSGDSGTGAAAVTVKEVTFASRGGANTVYGILSQPQAAGKYPGILVLHGGGGNAQSVAGIAKSYAAQGYVTLAVDLPHICIPSCSAYSTGPWRDRPAGEEPRLEVVPGPERSVLVDAELAGVEGFNWLRAQTNVDPDHMGIFGFSWGGYSTTMLSGLLGDKVKAAYAVFGCGFYDKGSFWKDMLGALSAADRETWTMYLDAGRRASNIKAAYFLEGESNDKFFWPEAVGATLNAVPGTTNHVWGPNLNHHQVEAGAVMVAQHMAYYLKGTGQPFAHVEVSSIEPQADGSKRVLMDVDAPAGVSIDQAQLYYSVSAPSWETRTWISLAATPTQPNRYVATLGADLAAQQLNFYGLITDTRTIMTSTAMYDSSSVLLPSRGGGSGGSGGAAGDGGSASGGAPFAGMAGVAGTLSGRGGADAPSVAGASGTTAAAAGSAVGGATSGSAQPPRVDDGCTCRLASTTRSAGEFWGLAGLLALAWRRLGRSARR